MALLNLTGLGLGYLLVRNWLGAGVSWVATIVFLVFALPVHPDAIPGPVLAGYLAFLVVVALHGALVGLNGQRRRPIQSPVALTLCLALLFVPIGATIWYTETVQRTLLDRLATADRHVEESKGARFIATKSQYESALDTYVYLVREHPFSRAAGKVPDRLRTFYATVGAPYKDKKYCDSVDPLRYLRGASKRLGDTTPAGLRSDTDDKFVDSLYRCGVAKLGKDRGTARNGGELYELFTNFPRSAKVSKTEAAIAAAVTKNGEGASGDDPCAAVGQLSVLRDQAGSLPKATSKVQSALAEDREKAASHLPTGTYNCGIDQYKSHDFDAARQTMDGFVDKYGDDKRVAYAKRVSIAAAVAHASPEAGTHLPTTSNRGGMKLAFLNASPESLEVLYTGKVTGRFTLDGCDGCTGTGIKACTKKSVPGTTIRVPANSTLYTLKRVKMAGGTIEYPEKVKVTPDLLFLCRAP